MNVHTRILGNVIYFMAALTSKPAHLLAVEKALLEKLGGSGVQHSEQRVRQTRKEKS